MVGRNLLEHDSFKKHEVLALSKNDLDLTVEKNVYEFIKSFGPDLVIHAAGKVGGIQANICEPINFLIENLDIGKNVVLGSYKAGVKKFLNLGSSCMYPKDSYEPLVEEMILCGPLEPTNEGYALAKIVTARLCDYIRYQNKNFLYKTIIPCNLYGRFDKFNPDNSHLIPAILHKLHNAILIGSEFVDIWGDGNARREFMYAGDFADLIAKAIEEFESLPDYMNVGLGKDFSINDYYQLAADVVGFRGKFIHDLTKPIGMSRKLVNIDKQLSWGWKHRTSLKNGLMKTYEFYLEGFKK